MSNFVVRMCYSYAWRHRRRLGRMVSNVRSATPVHEGRRIR